MNQVLDKSLGTIKSRVVKIGFKMFSESYIPGPAVPSESLDPSRGLCRLKFMKKLIVLSRQTVLEWVQRWCFNSTLVQYL